MELLTPESSNISEIYYNEDSRTLYVAFRNGGVYSYSDVESSVVDEFAKAESKGRYFYKNIRNNYKTRKIGIFKILNEKRLRDVIKMSKEQK